MHPEETLIPLAFFATVFGFIFLRTKENMALIEKGINPRKNYGGPKPYAYMKYALLLVGAGVGLALAYTLDELVFHSMTGEGRENPAIYFSLIAIGGGLGLYRAYKMEKNDIREDQKNNIDDE